MSVWKDHSLSHLELAAPWSGFPPISVINHVPTFYLRSVLPTTYWLEFCVVVAMLRGYSCLKNSQDHVQVGRKVHKYKVICCMYVHEAWWMGCMHPHHRFMGCMFQLSSVFGIKVPLSLVRTCVDEANYDQIWCSSLTFDKSLKSWGIILLLLYLSCWC